MKIGKYKNISGKSLIKQTLKIIKIKTGDVCSEIFTNKYLGYIWGAVAVALWFIPNLIIITIYYCILDFKLLLALVGLMQKVKTSDGYIDADDIADCLGGVNAKK